MASLRLICWKPERARELAGALQAADFQVNAEPLENSSLVRQFQNKAYDAVVIDLERLPSHGREVGAAFRRSKSLRHIPVVFAGGAADKIKSVRAELPDACFTDWPNAAAAIRKHLSEAPREPVRPAPYMDRFAGTPLLTKLGIKPGMQVALLGAPEGFEDLLDGLPEDVRICTRWTASAQLAIWFLRSARELELAAETAAARLAEGASVWLVHPKQTPKFKPDFNQNDVRHAGLACGLVDYKVCAVDSEWSALKFARKKK